MEPTKSTERSLAKDIRHAAWYYLGGRWGLIVLTAVVLVAGVVFNWTWLTDGIAPLFLVLALCAAMCGFGRRGRRLDGKSRATRSSPAAKDVDMRSVTTATDVERSGESLLVASDQPAPTPSEKNGADSKKQAAGLIRSEATKEKP